MKKSIGLLCFILIISLCAEAQVNTRVIGIRFGGGSVGNGGEISYQHGLNNSNRLELDLGLNLGDGVNVLGVAAIYHWVMNINGGFNWYIGPGAGFSSYQVKNGNGYIGLAVGGQIGLEYDFKHSEVPLLISLDARPMWGLLTDAKGFGWGAALGIRYIF